MPSRRPSRTRQQATLLTSQPSYPGFSLKVGGTKDRAAIGAVQQRLNQVGCGPVPENGNFDSETKAAVQLFQARSVDGQGRSLKIDGVVGPLTWAALFGPATLPGPIDVPISPLLKTTLNVAMSQVGVMEEPPGSNRGPQVDQYLKAVGLDPELSVVCGLRLLVLPTGSHEIGDDQSRNSDRRRLRSLE
jgi:hypothetical protein